MSKRILSFDVIRGWAILGNLMVHFFMLTSQVQGMAESGDLGSLSAFGFIQMGFIVIFGHWRGLFLLISAAVHWYTMNRKLRNGIPRGTILRQEFFKGVLLWLWAMFFYIFLAEWSISKSLVETGAAQVEWWKIYHADQFANIAWAIMINSVIFYFLSANEKTRKPWVGAVVFTVIGLLFVFPAPYVYRAAVNLWGIDFHVEPDHISNLGAIGWWDYVVRLFTNQFVARESPLMPHYAYSVTGTIIGIFISQEKPPNKKKFLGWGYGIAGLSILFGVTWFLAVDKALTLSVDEIVSLAADFHVHPTWYVFVTIGLLTIVTLSVFAGIEFNKKLNVERYMKISRVSRRAGFMSLTVYSLASIQAFLRMAMWGIFKLFNSPNANMFRTNLGLPTGWEFFMLGLELGLWIFILWIWEKGRYIGSIDWLFALILKGPSKMKKDKRWIIKDPLDTEGKLINPIPVRWVSTTENIDITYDFNLESNAKEVEL
ncbi:MAG: hypothetical protein FK734_20615 [Asgard group archaeon]|nr:hypothetical protein [Asgard group archaeon]